MRHRLHQRPAQPGQGGPGLRSRPVPATAPARSPSSPWPRPAESPRAAPVAAGPRCSRTAPVPRYRRRGQDHVGAVARPVRRGCPGRSRRRPARCRSRRRRGCRSRPRPRPRRGKPALGHRAHMPARRRGPPPCARPAGPSPSRPPIRIAWARTDAPSASRSAPCPTITRLSTPSAVSCAASNLRRQRGPVGAQMRIVVGQIHRFADQRNLGPLYPRLADARVQPPAPRCAGWCRSARSP